MTYSSGYITVPRQGVYFVYGQLYYFPTTSPSACSFRFESNGIIIFLSYESKIGGTEWRSQYGRQVKLLNKGDTLLMKVHSTCQYYFNYWHSLFGAFLLV